MRKKICDFGASKRGVNLLLVVFLILILWSMTVYRSSIPEKVKVVNDGDTVLLISGKTVRLLGINVKETAGENTQVAYDYLESVLVGKNVWLEYERFNNDKVWMWIGCESTPRFWAFRKINENPVGCKKGVLVNEQMIKMGWSKVFFENEAKMGRYGDRLYLVE